MRMVPDPRCSRKKKHDHAEILVCMVLGFLAGRTTLRRGLKWCRHNLERLKGYLPLENGIASPSTACRLLCGIDEYLFAMAFMEWIGELLSAKGIHIAIDGKALRAAASKVKNTRAPMIMNALDTATGLVLAQLPIKDKECELGALPELMGLLDVRNSIITIDAIGTQTNIMRQIIGKGGHFVLTVKKNQPSAYDEIMELFEELSADLKKRKECACCQPQHPELLKKYGELHCSEKNRDRYEHRFYKICNDSTALTKTETEWPFIKSVGRIRQIRIPVEKDQEGNDITPDLKTFLMRGSRRKPRPVTGDGMEDDIQDVGIVSDITMTAEEMGKIKRAHWAVENKLHHVLDDTFREDRSPAKKSKNNLALIRKFVYNILRLAMIKYPEYKIMTETMDSFADDSSLMEEYVFNGIESFY